MRLSAPPGLLLLTLLVAGPALAEPAPPAGAARLAADPATLDRFVAAALDGPPYYNFMNLPVDGGRLTRAAGDVPLIFFDWNTTRDGDPPLIDRVRALTGLGPGPDLRDPDRDSYPFMIVQNDEESLSVDPAKQLSNAIKGPFYTLTDPAGVPHAGCGGYAMSMHPLKPRELRVLSIRILKGIDEIQAQRCQALVTLRVLGLAGMGEIASGKDLPVDIDPVTMLTPQEELFLWLAYRIPIGSDRETVRRLAAERLAGLKAP